MIIQLNWVTLSIKYVREIINDDVKKYRTEDITLFHAY